MAMKNPCLNCTTVERPKDCDRKGCGAWQIWWLERWENLRKRYCVDEERRVEDGLIKTVSVLW